MRTKFLPLLLGLGIFADDSSGTEKYYSVKSDPSGNNLRDTNPILAIKDIAKIAPGPIPGKSTGNLAVILTVSDGKKFVIENYLAPPAGPGEEQSIPRATQFSTAVAKLKEQYGENALITFPPSDDKKQYVWPMVEPHWLKLYEELQAVKKECASQTSGLVDENKIKEHG